ncbi:MAG: SdpI family protein [Oscillospiraceae bacterium]|nr:SdpI family protein [Oscillospiraceae bacterium]
MTTEPILDPTAATEAVLDIDSIKELMDAFDPASLLPELNSIFDTVAAVCRIAVLAGPIILLVLGLAYLLFAPREANYYFGYRCYYGMGSIEAWRFTQRLAGCVLGGLGLILTGVMLVLSGSFAGMDAMDMVWKAFWCLVWQAVLVLIANAAIWGVTFFRFDARGNYRSKKRTAK